MLDFQKPLTRLGDQYSTVTGIRVVEGNSNYFEMYRDTFLDALSAMGVKTDAALENLLHQVAQYEWVGDFLDTPKDQVKELSAFGLILLDRVVRDNWCRGDNGFMLHEQLFECFEYVRQHRGRPSGSVTGRRRGNETRVAMYVGAWRWTWDRWQLEAEAYEHKRHKAAPVYVRLIAQEFTTAISGDGLSVSIDTIKKWMKEAPPTVIASRGKGKRSERDGLR